AARKFDAEFQQSIDKSVDNKEAIEELLKRTPGYFSWQGEYWPGHCNDFCAYLGKMDGAGLQKLLSQGDPVLDESVQKEAEQYRLTKEEFLEELNIRIYGYLFQCLTCKGHILHTDLDCFARRWGKNFFRRTYCVLSVCRRAVDKQPGATFCLSSIKWQVIHRKIA